MGYASQSGRARVSASNPQAFAVCDRCGMWHNRVDLRNQVEWRGAALLPTYIYVCRECYDVPQEQLRAIVISADPLPIIQPRVENFAADSTDQRTLVPGTTDPVTGIPIPNTDARVTQDGNTRTTQPLGPARLIPETPGLSQNAQPPQSLTTHYAVPLDLISVTANGTTVVSVTCRTAHGLSTGDQISADGLTTPAACGFYNVTVTGAMSFTYMVNEVVSAGPLLTSGSRIITANVGVPRDYAQIPQTGI